jgi:argininosuccinate synthase
MSRSSRPGATGTFKSRTQLIEFAEQHQIPIAKTSAAKAPFSVDANLLHASSEGKVLEDPAEEVPDYVYSRTDLAGGTRRTSRPYITRSASRSGDAVSIDGVRCRRRRCLQRSTNSAATTASAVSTSSRTASSA